MQDSFQNTRNKLKLLKDNSKQIKQTVIIRGKLNTYNDLFNLIKTTDGVVENTLNTKVIIVYTTTTNTYVDIFHNICDQHFKKLGSDKFAIFQESTDTYDFILQSSLAGDEVLILDAGIGFTKDIITRFKYCLNNFTKQTAVGPIGAIVPVSNNAFGRQKINVPNHINENDVDNLTLLVDQKLAQEINHSKWLVGGIISTFCLYVTKEALQTVGFPDFTIEDQTVCGTLWAIKLYQKGYYTVLAGNIYVYRNHIDNVVNTDDILVLPDKDVKEKQHLSFLIKLNITDQLHITAIKKLLNVIYHNKLADSVFIIDVSSKISLKQTLLNELGKEELNKLWSVVTSYSRIFQNYNDCRDYDNLYQLAKDAGADWVVAFDTGDFLEENVTRQDFDYLMNNPDQQCLNYTFNEYFLFEDFNTFRADDVWSKISSIRMSKVTDLKITGKSILASLSGYVPATPVEYVYSSSIRLRNLSLYNEDLRNRSKELLTRLEPNYDWDYIVNYSTTKAYPICPSSGITTYAPVNTGGHRLRQWLKHVYSFSKNILVGNDRNSLSLADKELIEKWGGKVVACDMSSDYSFGRNQIIAHCKTTHLMQLDIDERVESPSILCRMTAVPFQAWLFTIDNLQSDNKPAVMTETVRLIKYNDDVKYWGMLHETLDDYVRSSKAKTTKAPIKLIHFGFLWQSQTDLLFKMQKYMQMNLNQIKKYPNDPRAYSNLAYHLLEDGMYLDAMKLMTVSVLLSDNQPMSLFELAKIYLHQAVMICDIFKNSKKTNNFDIQKAAVELGKKLQDVVPQVIPVSPGHAKGFFDIYPQERTGLLEHLFNMERQIVMSSVKSTS